MEDSVKAVDCIGHGQQSKAPGDAVIIPTAEPLCEILKDELRRAALSKHRQGDDGYEEEHKVTNSANELHGIEEFPEPQIEDECHKDQRPHN